VSRGPGRLLVAGRTFAPTLISIGIVAAHAVTCWRPHRGWLVGACSAAYLTLVCMTFAPTERVLLPVVPACAILLALLATAGPIALRAVGFACLATILVQQALALPFRVREFADLHPFAEIEVARTISGRTDVERVGSTYANLHRFVPGTRYVSPGPPAPRIPDQPVAHLRREAIRRGVTAVVVGRRTAPGLFAALRSAEIPPAVELVTADDDVIGLLFDLVVDDGQEGVRWIAGFTAEPALWREGPLTLRVTLADDVDLERVAAVSIRLEIEPTKGPIVDLPHVGERTWQLAWPVQPSAGDWTLQAQLRLHDGVHVRGPRCKITVP
jgi:hypothetical protein